ncbi:putative copper-transporting ATPase HMA5 [Gracilariopsis chorda]|uniref:Putative copper-transporting ATPase HMA5 n=1 Tax=Gracilariopsis chorda TaxID=448386 RepID=A0A2V3IDZ1_9FLOR|nr:putative copper-transporting ATPase HMA5 [Gracilariopsis chorda]|eukprot:PXF40277.1 putative copper-transporting ATPase HMA5 [Gracilariopsis chorda]
MAAPFTLRVEGLSCAGCVRKVQNALLDAGAEHVTVDLQSALATGVSDHRIEQLIQVVEDAGKKATVVEPEPTITIKVTGMSCMGCVRKITAALKQLPEATDVHVDLNTGLATLRFPADPQQAVDAVLNAGKTAELLEGLALQSPVPTYTASSDTSYPDPSSPDPSLPGQSASATAKELVSLDLASPTTSLGQSHGPALTELVALDLGSPPASPATSTSQATHTPSTSGSSSGSTLNSSDVVLDIPKEGASALSTTTVRISGMTCASCVGVVEGLLHKLPSVQSARVNLLAGRAKITHDAAQTSPDELADAISAAGYKANILESIDPSRTAKSAEAVCANFRVDFPTDIQAQNAAKLLRFMDGVQKVDFDARTASIVLLPGVPKSSILHALEFDGSFGKMGVRQSLRAELDEIARGEGHGATNVIDEEAKAWRARFFMSLLFFLPIAVSSLVKMFSGMLTFRQMTWIHFALATPIQFVCGANFYRASYFALRKRRATMDVLVALSTSIAYFSSVIVMLFGFAEAHNNSLGHNVMFKVSAMIITMVLLGKWLESSAKRKAAAGVAELSALAPENAILFDEKDQVSCHTEVPVKILDVGDVVRLIPGDRVPADGEVIEGTSAVDESMLTGESTPVPKSAGDHVYGGTVNGCGSMLVRTTAVGSDAVLSQIVRLVNDAQTSRAPVEAFADRVSSVFVPSVVAFSLLVFASWYVTASFEWIPKAWYAQEGRFFFALLFALETMVIACPCALGLATPTAVMVASEVGAKHGVLFRGGGAAIEAAKNVRHVVFDKTGTLTVGRPEVVTFLAGEKSTASLRNASSLLQDLVYVVESQSHHPLATAITKHVADLEGGRATENETTFKVSWIEEVPGRGMKALVNKNEFSVVVGSREFALAEVPQEEIFTENEVREIEHLEASEGLTIVVAVVNKRYGCIFGLEDCVRPEARKMVEKLHSMNIGTSLVTGDSIETGRAVATKCGIPLEAVHARAMPWTKVDIVKELAPSCFVGDGINDAPALAAASMGIAIGAGAPVAAESAAVVLVGDDLRGVVNAIDLARTAFRRVRLNFCWAIGYNVLSIPLAAGILFPLFQIRVPPFVASGAMALSSTCVILSSLALRWYRPQMLCSGTEASTARSRGMQPSSPGSSSDSEHAGITAGEEVSVPLLNVV